MRAEESKIWIEPTPFAFEVTCESNFTSSHNMCHGTDTTGSGSFDKYENSVLSSPFKDNCSESTSTTRCTTDSEDSLSITDDRSHDISRRSAELNTHTSILNITDDDDEEEEEGSDDEDNDNSSETNFLFADESTDAIDSSLLDDDINEEPSSQQASHRRSSSPCCTSSASDAVCKDNAMDRLFENFVERLCFSHGHKETNKDIVDWNQQHTIYQDIQNLINFILCQLDDTEPLDSIINEHDDDDTPKRLSLPQRCKRVRKLLKARGEESVIQQPNILRTSYSMRGREISNGTTQDGYDSDPEVHCVQSKKHKKPTVQCHKDWHENICQTVQSALNTTWHLTWHHPNDCTFVSTPVWFERGTLIRNNNAMIEPRLSWKDNKSIRLLHICRLRQLKKVDRTIYPFVQIHNCIEIKTCDGQIHIFQANNTIERDTVLTLWKATVSRFCTLAVLEEAQAMLDEFFLQKATTPPPL